MVLDSDLKKSTFDAIADRGEAVVILSLDDEDLSHMQMRSLFEIPLKGVESLHFLTAKTKDEALQVLSAQKVHVLLLDRDLGLDANGVSQDGIQLIPEFRRLDPSMQILMVTGSQDFQHCVEAMKLGAFGYVIKNLDPNVIRAHIEKAVQVARLELERVRAERAGNPALFELAGRSPAMRDLRSKLVAMGETNRPILLIGESGTGKTHSARLIHEHRRSFLKQTKRPFFAVNIAELGKERIENELFGHEKGAYTGAHEMKSGYIELADGGTLFLDEIGEAPLDLQAKLLKVLDEKKFRRLGSGTERSSNFHLICATNRNLEEMVERKEFREDLYMRIATFPLRLPTLEERREDIPHLIRALLPKACADNSIFVKFEELPQDFIEYLTDVPFKGNVRGLEHQISRLLLLSPRDSDGRPQLHRWREVSGMQMKRSTTVKGHPKSLSEYLSQTLDFRSVEFPGFSTYMEELGNKIFHSAFAQMKNAAEVARVFKMSESAVSERRKRLGLQKKSAIPQLLKAGSPS